MWRTVEQIALLIDGGRAAVIGAMAAAGMTIAVSDIAAARYCAAVIIAHDRWQQARRRQSRMLQAMLLPQTDQTRVFTCFESRPTQLGTPWCCDWKAGWKASAWQCSTSPSIVH
jgi:hypothetical protein